MSRRNLAVLVVLLMAVASAVVVYFAYSRGAAGGEKMYVGVLYANDSGEPKGGFGWAGLWNVTIRASGETGRGLLVKEDPDLFGGVILKKYSYSISDFAAEDGSLNFRLDEIPVSLHRIERDEIRDTYHGYYVARYLPPGLFPEFFPNYYVEMAVKEG